MDSAFSLLLGFGYFPGTLVLGFWCGRTLSAPVREAVPVSARSIIAFFSGQLLSLPPLVLAAGLGHYAPAAAGGVGWLLAAFGLRAWWTDLRREWRRIDTVLAAVVLLLFAWHGFYRNESLFAGRDQGVYSNHAVHLARTGSLRAEPTFRDLYQGSNMALASGIQAGGTFFDVDAKNLYFQFPPTFALSLATAFGAGSFTGLFLFNPLLAALNAALCFVFVRRLLNPPWAAFATAVFSLNLAQVWIARITLSEVLTQSWLLAGLILLQTALRRRDARASLIGHGFIVACTLVRIDAFLVLIGLAGFDAWLSLSPAEDHTARQQRTMARQGAVLAVLLGALALGYGYATSPGYYADFTGRLGAMWAVAASFALATWLPVPRAGREAADRLLRHRSTWITLAILVVTAGLFGWWVRPHLQPFAHFVESMGQQGRDYRENTLRDLAAYLSPPGLALMLVGTCLALRRVLRERDLHWAPLLALWSVCALLYLYNPYISVDHIWKMRRFVPVILPGMAVLLALGLKGFTAALPRGRLRAALPAALGGVISIWIGWTLVPVGFTRLNAGAVNFIQSIDREIPDHALVVATVHKPILGPIQLVEQHDTVRATPGDAVQEELLRQAIAAAQQAGRPVVLLSPTPAVSDARHNARRFELVHPNLLRTTEPPPRRIEPRTRTAYLSVLAPGGVGLDPTATDVRLGANPIYGIRETGFGGQEFVAGIPFRWTVGPRATLLLPRTFASPPARAYLDLMAAPPQGSRVRLRIGDQLVLDQVVPASGGQFPLDLRAVDWNRDWLQLELESSTFRPSDLDPGSTDQRELGLRLAGIVLVMDPPSGHGRTSFGLGRNPSIQERGLHGLEEIHDEPARWTNGDARFTIDSALVDRPRRLRVPIAAIAPDGSDLEIIWRGQTVLQTHLDRAPAELVVDLPAVAADAPPDLELRSSTFTPAGTGDDRQLGVMINPLMFEW